MERGWTRETFAFALAVQNLVWGIAGPFAGAIADRWGAFRVLVVGGLLYAAGPGDHGAGDDGRWLSSAAPGCCSAWRRRAPHTPSSTASSGATSRPRSARWAMGITAAAGSFGQFLMVPVEGWLIAGVGWQNALFVLGLTALLIAAAGASACASPTARRALRRSAAEHAAPRCARPSATASFQLLTAGYFVCGFQVVFIGVHMPSYLKDQRPAPAAWRRPRWR